MKQQYQHVSTSGFVFCICEQFDNLLGFVFVVLCHLQVKTRTAEHDNYRHGSHVMQYGNLELNVEKLFLYLGSNPANDNATFIQDNSLSFHKAAVNQRDADLVYFWHKVGASQLPSVHYMRSQFSCCLLVFMLMFRTIFI